MTELGTQNDELQDKPETSDKRKFRCDECGCTFTRKHNLKTHNLTHSKAKPHTCHVCQSSFRRAHDLKRHSKLHTGERPYKCVQCGKSFARSDSLVRHNNSQSGCESVFRNSVIQERVPLSIAKNGSSNGIAHADSGENRRVSRTSPVKDPKRPFDTIRWRLNSDRAQQSSASNLQEEPLEHSGDQVSRRSSSQSQSQSSNHGQNSSQNSSQSQNSDQIQIQHNQQNQQQDQQISLLADSTNIIDLLEHAPQPLFQTDIPLNSIASVPSTTSEPLIAQVSSASSESAIFKSQFLGLIQYVRQLETRVATLEQCLKNNK